MSYCPTCGAPVGLDANFCTACGSEIAGRVHYAGFWRRVVSLLLDTLIIGIPSSLILGAAHISVGARGLAESAFFLAYGPTMIAARGQTLGMRATRTICRMADGTKPTWSALYTRTLVRLLLQSGTFIATLVSPPATTTTGATLTAAQTHADQRFAAFVILFLVPLAIDLLWMLRGTRRQTLHDVAAGTVIVRSEVEVRAPALPPLRP